uniref:Uncharacterized protein n=1 Tax=Panagrolaimus davidi TaxID=227884 RepID=A0A914QPJ6_9BILA
MKQEADKEEEGFNLVAAIKAELSTILPKIKFGKMKIEFLMEFVVEKGFFLSHTDFYYLFLYFERWNYIYQQKNSGNGYEESYDSDCEPPDYEDSDSDYSSYKYFGNDEDVFKAVYCLAEKQALQKQKMITSEGENFNVADSIKADLSEVIPKVKFFNMTRKFLMDFVVSRGVITEDEANTFCDTVIKVKHYGKIIRGTFNDTLDIRSAIRKQNSCNFSQLNNTQIRFLDLKFPIPSNPSTVEKMKGVEFYLCLETDGILTLKNYSVVQRSDYLIAEMKPKSKFQIIPNEATFLTTRHNNVVKNN